MIRHTQTAWRTSTDSRVLATFTGPVVTRYV